MLFKKMNLTTCMGSQSLEPQSSRYSKKKVALGGKYRVWVGKCLASRVALVPSAETNNKATTLQHSRISL